MAWRIAVLSLVVLASGCKANLTPEWEHPGWVRAIGERGHGLLLGVVVDPHDPGHPDGLRVRRVLAGSPAAEAGVRGGDVIVRLGASPIHTSEDLGATLARESADPVWQDQHRTPEERKASAEVRETVFASFPGHGLGEPEEPRLEFELTILRADAETVLPVRLTSGERHAEKVVAHVKAMADRSRGGLWLPFLLDISTMTVPADDWRAWLGVQLSGDPVVYEDVDVFPLLVASVFRWEATPIDGDRRVTVGRWPAQFSWAGDPREHLDGLSMEREGDRAIH